MGTDKQTIRADMETLRGTGAGSGEGPTVTRDSYVHLGEGSTPTSGVAVGPGGGGGVASQKEPVPSVPLAGTFASSCAAQVPDAVEDGVGVGCPKDVHYSVFASLDHIA